MPTVPTYNYGQIQDAVTKPQGLGLDSREVTAAFRPIDELGQVANQSARLAQSMADDMRSNADTLRVTEATAALINKKNELIWNTESGLLTKRGRDAFDVKNTYGVELDKYVKEVESTLANENQKALFRQKATSHLLDFNETLDKHIYGETMKYDEQTTQAKIEALQNDVLYNFQTPGVVSRNLEEIKSTVSEWAARNGIPEDNPIYLDKLREAEGKAHSHVISRSVDLGDYRMAHQYLIDNKEKLSGEQYSALSKLVATGYIKGEAEKIAMSVYESGISGKEALDEISKRAKNPEIAREARQAYKQTINDIRFAEEEKDRAKFEEIYDILEKTRGRAEIPDGQILELSATRQKAVQEFRAKLLSGEPIQTDWETWTNIQEMMSDPSRVGEFSQLNPRDYRAKLSNEHYERFVRDWTKVRQGDLSGVDEIRTTKQIVNQNLAAAGIDPSPKSEDERAMKEVRDFHDALDAEIKRFSTTNKRSPNRTELDEMTKRLVTETVVNRRLFWTNKKAPLYMLKPEDVDVSDIPEEAMSDIRRRLKAANMEETTENIAGAYISGMKAGVYRGQ